jgi:hypothetical protein
MRTIVPYVRIVVLICAVTLFTPQTHSQSITTGDGKLEFGLGLGPMFFLGDLGGTQGVGKPFVKDLDFPLTKFAKGIYINYYPSEWLGFRVAANHGVLEGDDSEAPNKGGAEVDRLERNLHFRSTVIEAYAALEFYPTVFFEQYDGLAGKFRPFALVGIGGYHFNPKAKDVDGSWVALQPLHLEGQGFAEYPQRKNYNLTQMEVPMGFGFKYYLKDNMYVGLEVLHRMLFTDYVDDVSTNYVDPIYFQNYLSAADAQKAQRLYYRGLYQGAVTNPQEILSYQRGDPTENDAYFSTVLRFGWRLNGSNSPNGRALRQLRCPAYY